MNYGLLRMLGEKTVPIHALFKKKPRIGTDRTDCHGFCYEEIRAHPQCVCRSMCSEIRTDL